MQDHPLKRARESRGLSQKALADLAGVSTSSVARIESDARIEYGVSLLKIATALELPVTDIAGPNQTMIAALLDSQRWLGIDTGVTR